MFQIDNHFHVICSPVDEELAVVGDDTSMSHSLAHVIALKHTCDRVLEVVLELHIVQLYPRVESEAHEHPVKAHLLHCEGLTSLDVALQPPLGSIEAVHFQELSWLVFVGQVGVSALDQ